MLNFSYKGVTSEELTALPIKYIKTNITTPIALLAMVLGLEIAFKMGPPMAPIVAKTTNIYPEKRT